MALAHELRTLEYSQRLRDRSRAVYAESNRSTGRVLYESALAGGAQALQRPTGRIKPGNLADLLSLDKNAVNLVAVKEDALLDGWIFANDDSLVSDVWSAGEHVVTEGKHRSRETIEDAYRLVLRKLLH